MKTFMKTVRTTAAALVVTGLLMPPTASAAQFGKGLRSFSGNPSTAQNNAVGNKPFSARGKLTNSGIIVVGGKDGAMRSGAKLGDGASLNPQPLPPKFSKLGKSSLGDSVSLNPQPLPPKASGLNSRRRGDKVGLNPQPLPPKFSKLGKSSLGNSVSLNPQPLPPKTSKFNTSRLGESVGLNPQPLPPKDGGRMLHRLNSNSQVIAAPKGTRQINGAGLPKGASTLSNASRLGAQTAQPQQLMSFGLGEIALAGAAKELLPSVADMGEGALEYIGSVGSNKIPPAPTDSSGKRKFEGSITAQADAPPTLGKRKIDPNAKKTLGKRKLNKGSITGKFDPNASTSIDKVIDQVSKVPGGGAANGNPAPTSPPPSNPAPSNPAPTSPAPAPQGPGQIEMGLPWQDLALGAAMNLAARRRVNLAPVEVAAMPVVVAQPEAVEPQSLPGEPASSAAVDVALEDVLCVAPATRLAGPAYRVQFRNQSLQAVGPFRVAIVAGVDGNVSDDAPRAVVEVAGMRGGQVLEATLRLPLRAMQLASARPHQPAGFSHLLVAIDATDAIAELDEENNSVFMEAAMLEPDAAK